MSIEEKIKKELTNIVSSMGISISLSEIELSNSKVKEHGDFASNLALRLQGKLHKKGLEIAKDICSKFSLPEVDKVEVAGPGFINFFLASKNIVSVIDEVLKNNENFANLTLGQNKKTLLEYVSANPTGALHLGHARGAAIGDSLARILKKAGYNVTREYYVNDAGNQIDNLAKSLQARYLQEFNIDAKVPDNGYHGEDIVSFAKKLKDEYGDKYVQTNDLEFFKEKGIELALNNIKKDLKNFRVEFDVFTSEKAIRKAHKVEEVLKELKPYLYEKDGAIFLNTTKDGDDKDRVIIKKDGSYTYLLPDIAYHKDKFDRGFEYLIDLFGADHHGYVIRLKSALKSLGYNPDNLSIDLVQMVRLFKDGQEFKMSKRTGNAVSLKELCEEVGVDGVRFFFVSRANSQHLDFNLDLAKSMSSTNPVYYCQYAHARLCTILEMASKNNFILSSDYSLLKDESELNLCKKLEEYKLAIKDSALTMQPCKITIYVRELAGAINEFYTKCRILDSENLALTQARLSLVKASQIVLKDALNLIGVSAPNHM